MAQVQIVTLSAALSATITSGAASDYAHDTLIEAGWAKSVIAECFPSGTSASFDEVKFNLCRDTYVLAYVATWGGPRVTAAMVKDGKGTQTEADNYDRIKRKARANFGMGTNRVMGDKLERPKQNGGGRTKKTDTPAAQAPVTTGDTWGVPPSFLHDLTALRDGILAFQKTAKLGKADREVIGVLAQNAAKLIDILTTPAKTDAPKTDETPQA